MADKNIGAHASSFSLGITVILLYAMFVSLVTFGFGSYIYRTGWQIEAASGGAVDTGAAHGSDIDNLLHILKSEQAIERAKQALAEDINALQVEAGTVQSRIDQSFAEIARARNAIAVQATVTLSDMTDYQYALPGEARNKYENLAINDALAPDHKVLALLDVVEVGFQDDSFDTDARNAFAAFRKDTEDKFDALVANLKSINAASHDVQAELVVVQARIQGIKDQRAAHDETIAGLRQTLPAGSVARARLAALTVAIPYFPDLLTRLVSFPTIFLTLIVTIAAGGLGTVVAFSRRYYSAANAEDLTLSRLFVNVGEGIAAAIAIFLFSGAGMLALTQGGGAINDVELSPYTVAFVAFLSGFMAEDAFASIQAAGKRIFNTEDKDKEEILAEARALVAQAEAKGAS